MRVLLVYPPITTHKLDTAGAISALLMGLAYVGAALREAGHEVKILNCVTAPDPDAFTRVTHAIGNDFTRHGLTDDEISQEIKAFSPAVVGIACMWTSYFQDAHNVARIVKDHDRSVLTVFGGAHTSTFPEQVMKDKNVDVAVVGEGEIAACELLQRHAAGRDLRGVKGIYHRSDGEVVSEPAREPIRNLDDIPFPAWDLTEKDVKLVRQKNMINKFHMRPPIGYMLTSRGCPKDCYFCSVKLIWSRRWRARSARNVVDEIEHLKTKYGCREFHFVDDNSSVSKKRMHEICDEILKRGLDVKLATPTGIAIETLDRELLSHMKQAGFYRFCFGIETGDPEGQKIIKKRIDLEKAKRVIAVANSLGFWTSATFIMGFPHQTMREIRNTINFTKRSNIDFAIFFLLNPQPGTEVYEILKQQGLIDLDAHLDPQSDALYRISIMYSEGFRSKHFSNEDLRAILAKTYREFLLHKLFSPMTYINTVRKIRSFEDLRYTTKLLTVPLGMLRQMLQGRRLTNDSIRGGRKKDGKGTQAPPVPVNQAETRTKALL